MSERPIDAVSLRLLNGEEVSFLPLSMGALRRMERRFGVDLWRNPLDKGMAEVSIPALYEALPLEARERYNEDAFAEILPADLVAIPGLLMRVLNISTPEPTANPMVASPEA